LFILKTASSASIDEEKLINANPMGLSSWSLGMKIDVISPNTPNSPSKYLSV